MLLGNASRGKIVAKQVVTAPGGMRRLWILRIARPAPGVAIQFDGEVFWSSFAKEAVDVVFLDRASRVLATFEGVRPWRATRAVPGATRGLLLMEGTCARVPVLEGDRLEFTPLTSERIAAGAVIPEHL